jgi:hypothetical protein
MAPVASGEIRFCERFIGWLDANLAALPEDSPVRLIAEECGTALARRCGLPGLGTRPLGSLADATTELEARLAEVGAQPMEPLTPEQFRVVAAGIPIDLDELRSGGDDCAARWLASTDGRGVEAIALAFHSAGVLKGALVQSWRR